jgi:hypothetical protein
MISLDDACDLDPAMDMHWRPGALLVFKVCGFDRVGMVNGYSIGDDARAPVEIHFLMIDTILVKLDGGAAHYHGPSTKNYRKIQSWDILSIHKLMFPPNEDQK